MPGERPFRTGTLLALLAAAAFGVTAPLVQRFGKEAGPFATAALIYFGAAAVSLLGARGGRAGAGLGRHAGRIAVAAFFGSFFAPACLAFGLQRASGTAASLMLNLEAPLTVVLASLLLREPLGSRVLWALPAMLSGTTVLVLGEGLTGSANALGLSAVAAATLGWAIDSVVFRPLADFDPGRAVFAKTGPGALLALGVALALGEPFPSLLPATLLVACGGLGYGLALRFYLLAQRRIGAARTGSLFSLAPFVGALAALGMGQGNLRAATLLAAVFFSVGAYLHATEAHNHEHTHEPLDHEHAHRHDDGHHDHVHDPAVLGEHTHRHRHEPVTHRHSHAPDLHHTHGHD